MDEPASILLISGGLGFILTIVSMTRVSINLVRLSFLEKMAEEENNKNARILLKLLEDNKDKILFCLNFCRTLLSVVMGALMTYHSLILKPFFPTRPFFSLWVSLLVLLLWVEIIPQILIFFNPEKGALLFIPVARFFNTVFVPLVNLSFWLFTPFFSNYTDNSTQKITEDEIIRMVEEGKELGVIEEGEQKMIRSIFEFADTIAKEIMIPRVDMICADCSTKVANMVDIMVQSGFSRIPVYEDSIDKMLGIVYGKDLLMFFKQGKGETPVSEIARRPPFFVPGTKPISQLLREMQKGSISIAIVVDEYGGTDGLITIEDILEEIVGEITDEHDREVPRILQMEPDTYLIDARMNIEDVNSELNLKIPFEEYETLGGYVYGILGHIPTQGESITDEQLGICITVEKILRQRITRLRLKKLPSSPEEN